MPGPIPQHYGTPKQTLERFYEAEAAYMQAQGTTGNASFDAMKETLSPEVVLHQSPDLPFGGEYVGHKRYEEWAAAMSAIFDHLEVREPQFFEKGNQVIVTCRFVTRSRLSGVVQDLPMVQVVTVKEGKITDFRPFYWNVPQYTVAAQSLHES